MYRFFITIGLLITATIANYTFSRSEAELARKPLSEFPKIIGEWRAFREEEIDNSSMEVLQVDDYIMRSYVNSQGEVIEIYIGYFKSQREGKQAHSPRLCLPGAGWYVLEHKKHRIDSGAGNPTGTTVNIHLMGRLDRKEIFVWWYFGRGRIVSGEYLNKIYLIWDSITKHRTDGGLIRINTAVTENAEDAFRTCINFMNRLLPLIPEYTGNN